MQTYEEFLKQNVDFPQEGFEVIDNELHFEGIDLINLIYEYGTPLRFTYLPSISRKIRKARLLFQQAFLNNDYRGSYTYCYCTKSSHFSYILEEVLKNDTEIETSSAFDIPIVRALYRKGKLSKDNMIICNGFKDETYTRYISDLINDGFHNTIPILDNLEELRFYEKNIKKNFKVGMRIATEERPDFQFYTSRLGIRAERILDFYWDRIKDNPKLELKVLHFFINSGIKDAPYYWEQLEKCVYLYCELKKECETLQYLDIGGGFPFKNTLAFEYDYEYIVNQIVHYIKTICESEGVREPDIITEFGAFTVAESSGVLFEVLGKKQQNDRENWFMIDGSMITTLPDIWATNQRFILLPINNWDAPYQRVNIGGMTCDGEDYYNAEVHLQEIYMPKTKKVQYLGFFHTGAYQQTLGGVGGVHHCLIPTPKQIIIDKEENGELSVKLFSPEQKQEEVLKILGYDEKENGEKPIKKPNIKKNITFTQENK